jgi:hypothetical protein
MGSEPLENRPEVLVVLPSQKYISIQLHQALKNGNACLNLDLRSLIAQVTFASDLLGQLLLSLLLLPLTLPVPLSTILLLLKQVVFSCTLVAIHLIHYFNKNIFNFFFKVRQIERELLAGFYLFLSPTIFNHSFN